MKLHRHRKSWLIAGGRLEWCYECGAFRPLHQIPPNSCTPAGPWRVPTGIDGENPADRSIRAQRAYDERARRKALRS